MNRETKRLLSLMPLIQAHGRGEVIEVKTNGSAGPRWAAREVLGWKGEVEDYRIAPKVVNITGYAVCKKSDGSLVTIFVLEQNAEYWVESSRNRMDYTISPLTGELTLCQSS